MKRVFIIAALVCVTAAVGFILSGVTQAGGPPFSPIHAAENIGALAGSPLFAVPSSVSRLPSDMRSERTRTYRLGQSGYAWRGADGGVCVLMKNNTGTCFSTFKGPVLLFLTGRSIDRLDRFVGNHEVTGVVPDSVTNVTLVTESGLRVPTSIEGNAFHVEIPAGDGIVGEFVTLTSGSTFFNEDRLSPPRE